LDEDLSQHVDIRSGSQWESFRHSLFYATVIVNKMVDTFLQDKRFGFGIDMLHLARESVQATRTAGILVAYIIAALHQYVTVVIFPLFCIMLWQM
jgi:hypothetical protein